MTDFVTYVSGVVYALEPIQYPDAYARATFVDVDEVSYSAEGKELRFNLIKPFTVAEGNTLNDITKDIVKGASTNVSWNITCNS